MVHTAVTHARGSIAHVALASSDDDSITATGFLGAGLAAFWGLGSGLGSAATQRMHDQANTVDL